MRRYLVFLILATAGCAPVDNSTTLQNDTRQLGKGRVSVLFTAVDGVQLQEGVWVPPPDTTYRVPAGKKNIAIRVVHDPQKNYLSLSVFETCVSLSATLKTGRVYVPETKLKDDTVTVSVKDQVSGETVSETAKGRLVALDPVKSCALAASTK